LIPAIKLKKLKIQEVKSKCGKYRPEYIPPHDISRKTYTFISEYTNGAQVEVVQETAKGTHNEYGEYSPVCYGTAKCSLHGIAVNKDVVLEYAPKPGDEWHDFECEDPGVEDRMEDEELPPYFLEEWRAIVAHFKGDPLREHFSIPSEISDDILYGFRTFQNSAGIWKKFERNGEAT
jgi:hypothetical protein